MFVDSSFCLAFAQQWNDTKSGIRLFAIQQTTVDVDSAELVYKNRKPAK
jgi:hypothetical protein